VPRNIGNDRREKSLKIPKG